MPSNLCIPATAVVGRNLDVIRPTKAAKENAQQPKHNGNEYNDIDYPQYFRVNYRQLIHKPEQDSDNYQHGHEID